MKFINLCKKDIYLNNMYLSRRRLVPLQKCKFPIDTIIMVERKNNKILRLGYKKILYIPPNNYNVFVPTDRIEV